MSIGRSGKYSDLCQQLSAKYGEVTTKIRISNENAEKLERVNKDIAYYEKSIKSAKETLDELTKLSTDIQEYINAKRKRGTMAVNAALLAARNVVPDAMGGVRLTIDGKEAWLENENGMLMERMEGGGFRATCSLFMRKVALASSPDIMQLLILDELLAKLSPESSVIVSSYLPIIAQDMQVLIIEQKKEVYSQTNAVRYNFFLTDGCTVVEEEEVSNGDTDP